MCKIERDADLLEKLPEGAKGLMEQLLVYEVGQHGLRHMRRASRKISWSTLFAIIFVAVLTAVIDWLLAYLALTYGWGWWLPFGIVTLFGLMLSLSGIGQLFVYPDDSDRYPDDDSDQDPAAASR